MIPCGLFVDQVTCCVSLDGDLPGPSATRKSCGWPWHEMIGSISKLLLRGSQPIVAMIFLGFGGQNDRKHVVPWTRELDRHRSHSASVTWTALIVQLGGLYSGATFDRTY